MALKIRQLNEYLWEIPKEGGMRVPARIYATKRMMDDIRSDNAPQQAANVAHLPGIVKASLAMPDIHWGYGFPIGGVAAFDLDEGVISPGGVGYDINCLAGTTPVLHAHGYTRPIAEMASTWREARLLCQDFAARRSDDTPVVRYLKLRPSRTVYRVTTEDGAEVLATGDHPFWTPAGMIPLENLRPGDPVARYPFEGVPYEPPGDRVLVDEAAIRRVLAALGKAGRGNATAQVLRYLERRGLLPLRADAPALPFLIKALGYLFGDGTLYFSGGTGKGTVWFFGKAEDLEDLRHDLFEAGFTPSRCYRRRRRHTVRTTCDTYHVSREETSFKVASTSFAVLMAALGAPVGEKAAQDYSVPDWLKQAPRWHQRLFLAAFFGAELGGPRAFASRNCNFQAPMLSLNKKEGHVPSGRRFLEDLGAMLEGFGVAVRGVSERAEQVNADGTRSYRLRLVLSSTPESLRALWGRVGYAYNRGRQAEGLAAVAYLGCKQQVLARRRKAAERAVALQGEGVAAGDIVQALEGPHINRRFVERSLYGARGSVRCGAAFEPFESFRRRACEGLGTSGMVWLRIAAIEPVDLAAETGDPYVYDFTVAHADHNFVAGGFVVSNCGVRLMASELRREDVVPRAKALIEELFRRVPTGVGVGGAVKVNTQTLRKVAVEGAHWAVKAGYGTEDDLGFIEEGGRIEEADPGAISDRAWERGRTQLGTLGSGNHFLEVDYVAEIYDAEAARVLGLFPGQVVVIIHTGSRGFGYQTCDDYLAVMDRAMRRYNITLPDRQLACAPLRSSEGKAYLGAMRCAVNFAFANRQIIAHNTRLAFAEALGLKPGAAGLRTVYEVAHNIAKIEEHEVDGRRLRVCVHRKGATRAFGPGRPEVPVRYRAVGQPVLIPGDMGRYSYVLVGTETAMHETFGSTCHGAGRRMSRRQAKKAARGRNVALELEREGIFVRGASLRTIDEEIPEAYKDVADVVDTCALAGISKKVAQLRPIGCIKG